MNILLRILLLYLFSLSVCAQQTLIKIDSLQSLFEKFPPEGNSFQSDTILVNLLCEIGGEYVKSKDDSSIFYLNKAVNISEKYNYKQGSLKASIQIAKYYSSQFLTVRSSEYWLKALAMAEKLKYYQEIKYITGRVGNNYLNMQDYQKSLYYFHKHSILSKSFGTLEEYLLSLNNIGIVYFSMKDYKKALYYFSLCNTRNQKLKSFKVQNAALINIGKVMTEMKEYESALDNFKTALQINDGYKDRIAFVTNEIARVLLLQNKFKEALSYAHLALKNTININTTSQMKGDISKVLADIYEKLGKTDSSYKHFKEYTKIRLNEDSIKNSQLLRFTNLDYQTEKQNQHIVQLNTKFQEEENTNKIMLVGVIALLVIIIVAFVYSQFLANKNRLIEEQKTAIQKLNESLEFKVIERTQELTTANEQLLKKNKEIVQKNKEISQALVKGQTIERKRVASELHDNLGGTISSLKWRLEALNRDNLSSKEQKIYDGILTTMHNVYADVRQLSHNLLPVELEEKGLIKTLEKYIKDLNNNPLKTEFKLITANVNEPIRQDVTLEIYCCCLEAVNNTIKHANASEVLIKIIGKDNGELEINISDNGIGFDNITKDNGNGLNNILNRAERINAKVEFKSEYKVGTQVLILVPNYN